MNNREPLERLYALVANEEDARTCIDISEQACREVPGNFCKIIVATMLTQTGDLLINPKTVLAWLLGAVGAPSVLVAVLVPIRESGSLMPQLMIGAWVRRLRCARAFGCSVRYFRGCAFWAWLSLRGCSKGSPPAWPLSACWRCSASAKGSAPWP